MKSAGHHGSLTGLRRELERIAGQILEMASCLPTDKGTGKAGLQLNGNRFLLCGEPLSDQLDKVMRLVCSRWIEGGEVVLEELAFASARPVAELTKVVSDFNSACSKLRGGGGGRILSFSRRVDMGFGQVRLYHVDLDELVFEGGLAWPRRCVSQPPVNQNSSEAASAAKNLARAASLFPFSARLWSMLLDSVEEARVSVQHFEDNGRLSNALRQGKGWLRELLAQYRRLCVVHHEWRELFQALLNERLNGLKKLEQLQKLLLESGSSEFSLENPLNAIVEALWEQPEDSPPGTTGLRELLPHDHRRVMDRILNEAGTILAKDRVRKLNRANVEVAVLLAARRGGLFFPEPDDAGNWELRTISQLINLTLSQYRDGLEWRFGKHVELGGGVPADSAGRGAWNCNPEPDED